MAKSSFFSGTGTTPTNVESVASSKAAAEASENAAAASAAAAAQSATQAGTSNAAADTAKVAAQAAQAAAETAETNAATSAASAATSLAGIGNSETNAATSASNSAASASAAAASASSASASATSAASDAASAATSLSNIGSAETNAAASATSAASSATSASTDAASASASQVAAAASEAAAATSEANSATSETNAATSASQAATSATNSATSEANAATSASSASTSASNAASSASAASASQVAAAASAASAANAYDTFDDRYLGSKTADPTVDNDGNALVQGSLYFNSTANEMRVYDGGSWIAASSAGGASLLEYKYTATSGQTTFSGADDNANTLSYTQDNLIVTLNGVVLENGADYTATNGTSVVLASGAATSDELNVIAFKTFTTADMVAASTGGTFYGNVAMDANLTFGDNDKAIFGAGSDLQIYHDGSNSYIDDAGTGGLIVRADNFYVRKANDVENMIIGSADGAVTLYHDNAAKLATTSTGVDITGTLTSDALNVSAASPNIDVTDTGTSHASQDFLTNSSTVRATIGVERSTGGGLFVGSSPYAAVFGTASSGTTQFATNNNVRMTLDTNGNLGIGTTVPVEDLHIKGTNPRINVEGDGSSYYPSIRVTGNYGGISLGTYYGGNISGENGIVFLTGSSATDGGTQRMKLDSSGALLVGKSAQNSTVTGSQLNSDGLIIATRSSAEPLLLNRKTSDGNIATFQKDGTTVGSIGSVASGANLYMSAASGVGLGIGGDNLYPVNASGSSTDGSLDIGDSTARFKDLYLSGGVYLGGTGSSNKLTDYEQGTFTPVPQSTSGGLSYNTSGAAGAYGRYTKVGNLVTCWFDIYFNITAIGSGSAMLSGFPFSTVMTTANGGYSAANLRASTALNAAGDLTAYYYGNSLYFEQYNGYNTVNAFYRTGANVRVTGEVAFYIS